MIIGFFLSIFYTILAFFINTLPIADFPSSITTAIRSIWYYINSFSFLFPVSTLLSVIAVATVFHGALITWRLAHLIGRYIRGR